jgi:hypothetical protein
MPTVGYEPTIAAGERASTYVLDRAANGTVTVCQLVRSFQHFTVQIITEHCDCVVSNPDSYL